MRLWVVRHGQTEWSETGRHTGRTDVPLLAAGEAQAEAVGQWLSVLVPQPALVLTSPLARASETCRLAGYGDAASPDEDLQEWDYGDYEGLTTDQIREQRPGWTLWTEGVPNGESAAEVGRRADRLVERARGADGDALYFSHGHMLRVLAARWTGLPPAAGRIIALGAAAVCSLGWEREDPVIEHWNMAADLVPPATAAGGPSAG